MVTGAPGAGRVRPHREDVLQPERRAHGELRQDGSGERSAHAYHQEIEDVRSTLVRLAGSVIEAIRARPASCSRAISRSDYLISADDEIDARSLDLEEEIYRLMALQAPVAVDLRVLVSAVKILGEIERSADLAVNICSARRLYGHPRSPCVPHHQDGRAGTSAVHAAIDAYVDNDAAKAAAIDDMDSLLDALQSEFIQVIFESHAAGRIDLQVAVQLAVVARFYERIGDHAVNIGERVRYTVTGWLPEHDGAAPYRERERTRRRPRPQRSRARRDEWAGSPGRRARGGSRRGRRSGVAAASGVCDRP